MWKKLNGAIDNFSCILAFNMKNPLVLPFLLFLSVWNYVYAENVSLARTYPLAGSNQLRYWGNVVQTPGPSIAQTAHGIAYPSLTASQTVLGNRGPILLQDMFLLEKSQSFNRERIPQRAVHAKGAGAFGFFVCREDISNYTRAAFLQQGKKTRVGIRISTVGGEPGSSDTWIDPKGFAVKFYTEEGIHDLVGNNIEVFPIRDPMLFTDINRSRKRNPATNLRDATSFWDFTSMRPETTLHTLRLFSDEGTPKSLRGMDAAGVHTYKMVNSDGQAVYVKFHWITHQPKDHYTPEESIELAGSNSEVLTQDLFDAIQDKNYPSWDLKIQVMTFEEAEKHPQNPFDITKHWRREDFPLIDVGTMTLNENPLDYFSQIEQLAFSPSRMVPGIEPSPDRMLHARIFSYPDAQMYRLGVNFHQIPVNRCPFEITTYQRDGRMNVGKNGGGEPNYFPNSFHGHEESTEVKRHVFSVSGDVDRVDWVNDDDFSQAKLFLEKDIDAAHRERITYNIAHFLSNADPEVQEKFVKNIGLNLTLEFVNSLKANLEKMKKMKAEMGSTYSFQAQTYPWYWQQWTSKPKPG